MRPNESGTTRVSMSRTIASLNDLRIFVTRSSADSITFDTIRKRSKPCFIPFFKMDVELFMRTYIEVAGWGPQCFPKLTIPRFRDRQWLLALLQALAEPRRFGPCSAWRHPNRLVAEQNAILGSERNRRKV